MNQLAIPYAGESQTSAKAAERIKPCALTLRLQLLALLKQHQYGLTDEQMQRVLRMNPSTQRPRRIELQRLGLVVDSGIRRKTNSGRRAVVWVAA